MTPNTPRISAVALDIANTLERVETSDRSQLQACGSILDLLKARDLALKETPVNLHRLLRERYRRMHSWRLVHMREPTPNSVWENWLLPEYPRDAIASIAHELTYIWMGEWYERTLIPDALSTLSELKKRGYRLACLSNTLSSSFSLERLRIYGLYDAFETIVLSSDTLIRKPDPLMFQYVAERLSVRPPEICYIGDQFSRDIVGGINAGYGRVVLVRQQDSGSRNDEGSVWPDLTIQTLTEILENL